MHRRAVLCGAVTSLAVGLPAASAQAPAVVADPLAVKVPYEPPVVPGMSPPAWSLVEERLHTDWAYLAYYKKDNAAVRALPQVARRVVFIGDSITKGWPDSRPQFFSANGFVGRGIGWQVAGQMLVRFRQDVIALAPLAVHINGGTNDISDAFGIYDPEALQNCFQSMADLARTHGIRVILSSITPAGEYRWRPGLQPRLRIPEMNSWLAAYAAAQGFVFADYTAALGDGHGAIKPYMSYDGVHPTADGYALMEPVALNAVAKALSSG